MTVVATALRYRQMGRSFYLGSYFAHVKEERFRGIQDFTRSVTPALPPLRRGLTQNNESYKRWRKRAQELLAILGGSMHNNVVEAVCDSFSERGISTCRFNCRGIGGSSGWISWRGNRDVEDLLRVSQWMINQPNGPQKLLLIGYSHGSLISMAAAAELPRSVIAGAAAISYPWSVSWFITCMNGSRLLARAKQIDPTVPLFFIIGSRDNFTSPRRLKSMLNDFADPSEPNVCEFQVLHGFDHFWWGGEGYLCDEIHDWFGRAGIVV